jgi:hypothetical protein
MTMIDAILGMAVLVAVFSAGALLIDAIGL